MASPFANAYTFEFFSNERKFYMPKLSLTMEEHTYEIHSYRIEYPVDAPNSLKIAILKDVFGTNCGNSFNTATNNFLNNFMHSDDNPQLTTKFSKGSHISQFIKVSGELVSQNKNLIVYKSSRSEYYVGAAHGMYGINYLNYYTPFQEALTISDILLPPEETSILQALHNNAQKVVDLLYSDDFSYIEISESFFISSKGITFVYQPYEIGPYASGIIEITIPKSQLTGCLTTLGQKLLK